MVKVQQEEDGQDKKLQQKIIAEDLSNEDTVKYGVYLEEGNVSRSNNVINRVAKLEEHVRQLQTSIPSPSCQTCVRSCVGRKYYV